MDKMKETLSSKIWGAEAWEKIVEVLEVKDVREFIKDLKEFIDNLRMSTHAFMGKKEGDIFRDFMKEEINKLAGKELK